MLKIVGIPIIILSIWWFQLPIVEISAFSTNAPIRRITGTCLSTTTQSKDEPVNDNVSVYVYEDAFSSESCEMLHYLAGEHYERTNDGSSFFTRPPHNDKPLTPIEHAIDSALIEFGDNTKRVEYWSRDEYMNIDTHADIDETMLEDEGVVRCPKVGHVLYLEVKPGLHGPTCVFPKEQKGWGLTEDSDDGKTKDMVVVPAVEGRLLRFPGSAMHAVPNPPDRWLLSLQEEKGLRKEEEDCEKEENEDDDDDEYDDFEDDEEEIERSVLLFNTWPDGEPGPRGVDGDIATGALPEGIEISEEDAAAYLKSQEAEILSEWEEEYGRNGEDIRCNPFSEWSPLNIQSVSSGSSSASINVSLMGREKRRLYPKKYARLIGPHEEMRDAVKQDTRVSAISLRVE
mmetsp:Transcript_44288/g.106694  ORF Transcript_44288/g.106694 Transcript_44288/m.106694 type:complete len:400 (-) Transcript_44288:23-1222(-)